MEVYNWFVDASEGARQFYDANETLVENYESKEVDAFGKNKRFKKYWYLKYAGIGLRIAQLLLNLGMPKGLAAGIATGILALVKSPVVDYVGDVAIYTPTDKKSKSYEVRQHTLGGATDMIRSLISSTEPEYGRMGIAGHSLGSVIAYDALNRIN